MRIQNRWVVFVLFLICSFGVLIDLYRYRRTKTVDLSNLEINDIKLNEESDRKGYEVNKKVRFDRFRFCNSKAHPSLTVKVREKDNIVKGIILVRDEKTHTNFDGGIGPPINNVTENLGLGYKRVKVGSDFSSVKYVDKDNHLKLDLLYQDLGIKHIELFSK